MRLAGLVQADRPIPGSVSRDLKFDFKKRNSRIVFDKTDNNIVSILALGWAEEPLYLSSNAGPYHLTRQILHPFLLLPVFDTRRPASNFQYYVSGDRWRLKKKAYGCG